ncbi:hypothetical protein [Aureimonas sp. N4]|uniref:hypothetical protein n=1 Tax=Aureimonas sp. N4 TaxID=1638165 RepID=UPI0007845679|nr:hypothetical protein [Aureimonas sp. N4]
MNETVRLILEATLEELKAAKRNGEHKAASLHRDAARIDAEVAEVQKRIDDICATLASEPAA